MNVFDSVGLSIHDDEALTLLNDNLEKADFYDYKDSFYVVLPVDENIELWYYGVRKESENFIRGFSVFYNTDVVQNFECNGDTEPSEYADETLSSFTADMGSEFFSINMYAVDGFKAEKTVDGQRCLCKMTFYAQRIKSYKDRESYLITHKRGMAEESCIPCGTFPASADDEDWEPSADILLNGIVQSAEKRTNGMTGVPYWYIILRCFGFTIPVVASTEIFEKDPEPGNVLEGLYEAFGNMKPIHTEKPDDPHRGRGTLGELNINNPPLPEEEEHILSVIKCLDWGGELIITFQNENPYKKIRLCYFASGDYNVWVSGDDDYLKRDQSYEDTAAIVKAGMAGEMLDFTNWEKLEDEE